MMDAETERLRAAVVALCNENAPRGHDAEGESLAGWWWETREENLATALDALIARARALGARDALRELELWKQVAVANARLADAYSDALADAERAVGEPSPPVP